MAMKVSQPAKVLNLQDIGQLNPGVLEKIWDGSIVAIIVKHYVTRDACEHITKNVELLDTGNTYSGSAANVGSYGVSLYEAGKNPEKLPDYYIGSMREQILLRQACEGYILPIDKLRIELDESWPYGCHIDRFHEHRHRANCGLNRIVGAGGYLGIHTDRTDWDIPNNNRTQAMLTQFGTNVYMEMPEQGGELELWARGPETEDDYEAQMLAGSDYELDRDNLGEPAVVIRPEVGDLILFDARKPHAVKRNKKGRRVTASCFVGYYGPDKPLSTFS